MLLRSLTYGLIKSSSCVVAALKARSNGMRFTETFRALSSSLARFSIQLVATVSAGPPCGGVVFEAAILRWIVRRRHHDAVRQIRFSVAVVNQNRSRDDWRRSDAVVLLNQRLNLICSPHFERRALRRSGKRVRVHAEVERTRDVLHSPVVADGLDNSQNMGFVERGLQR